jgi:hypothetical protein
MSQTCSTLDPANGSQSPRHLQLRVFTLGNGRGMGIVGTVLLILLVVYLLGGLR